MKDLKKAEAVEPIFRLKVSEHEKYKDEGEWFKEYLDFLVPYDTAVVEDYTKMKLAYDFVNNNLEGYKDELDKYCSPMLDENAIDETINREEILPFNQVSKKVNIFAGELLKRKDAHKIVLLSDNEIKSKNQAYIKAIKQSILEQVQLQIEVTQMKFNGASEREIQEYKEQYATQNAPEDINIKNFQTDWEIFNSKALKYCYFDQDVVNKKQTTIRHTVIADRVFLYVGFEFGHPVIKVLNPLFCGFHKSPDIDYVQKGDYFWHKTAVTLPDVYQEYSDKLTDKELSGLVNYTHSSSLRTDDRHNVIGTRTVKATKAFRNDTEDMFRSVQDANDKNIGQSMGQGTNHRYNNNKLLWKTHIEFKAMRELIFLTYIDEMGEEIVDLVDAKFEIPKNATKMNVENQFGNKVERFEWVDPLTGSQFTADRLWIPRRYEITRLGEDVYVDFREVPNQPLNLSNPFKEFELSYKGRIFSNLNSESISAVQRALPNAMQYIVVKMIMMRELGKYQGYSLDIDVDQIPDYLMLDADGEQIPGRDKVAIWRLYLKRMGYNLYSGSQSADGRPPATRSPGSKSNVTGTAAELINLSQLLDYIDAEIGMAMGISPQREANYSSGSNLGDNQQAITQSHHITEPLFFMHAEVWRHALNEWLKLFRIYCKNIFRDNPNKKEHFIEYIMPNGTKELLRITPDVLDHEDIGLYLSNSGQDQFYREMMTQMMHAFGQNAGEGSVVVSSLMKAIAAGDSPEEIHKMIQLESQRQQKRMEQMELAKQETQKMMLEREIENREDVQAHELDKIDRKGEWDMQGKAIDVYKLQDDLNKDQDGVPDPLEAAKIAHDMYAKDRELNQKDRELELKAQKDKDDKEVKTKEIAAKNKQTNSSSN